MTAFKAYTLIFWLLLLFVAVTFADKFRHHYQKRRAERILSSAKFYLFATTAAYPQATRKRDCAALELLTEKIIEVNE